MHETLTKFHLHKHKDLHKCVVCYKYDDPLQFIYFVQIFIQLPSLKAMS